MNLIRDWFQRNFSNPQVVILAALIIAGVLIIAFFGGMLAPVLAAMVLAYLLEGLVGRLEALRVPRLPSVLIVFLLFMAVMLGVLFILLPRLSQQIAQFVQQVPAMVALGQRELLYLPQRYPEIISSGQINELMDMLKSELVTLGQHVVSVSLASVRGLVTLLVYLVLVPFLVFFFLKDKERILVWMGLFLPRERALADTVWRDVNRQIGNYVRGKFWEIVIVWSVSYVTFTLFGLDFAMMLALLVGLSVLVPYIGATVMYLPIALIAFFQWGLGAQFVWIMIVYSVIQILDGNFLAPLLMSEVTNLHPIAVITAVLVFGGLWGFWGIFFAIPLATLVNAVINAWPERDANIGKEKP